MNARKIGCAAILCTVAFAARAQSYTEIWNPPEARARAPVRHGAHSPARACVPRVAKKAIVPATSPSKEAMSSTQSQKKHGVPVIAPRIGPDGRAMQV